MLIVGSLRAKTLKHLIFPFTTSKLQKFSGLLVSCKIGWSALPCLMIDISGHQESGGSHQTDLCQLCAGDGKLPAPLLPPPHRLCSPLLLRLPGEEAAVPALAALPHDHHRHHDDGLHLLDLHHFLHWSPGLHRVPGGVWPGAGGLHPGVEAGLQCVQEPGEGRGGGEWQDKVIQLTVKPLGRGQCLLYSPSSLIISPHSDHHRDRDRALNGITWWCPPIWQLCNGVMARYLFVRWELLLSTTYYTLYQCKY